MNTLVRFSPALSKAFSQHSIDDIFAGLLRSESTDSASSNVRRDAATPLRIEVKEDANVYNVSAIIPGVKKEEINVAIDGNTVTISAEIKRESEAKEGERVLHTERFYGKTSRSFSLEQEVDEARVEAKYADGILSLILPKKVPVAAKRITIQ